MRTTESERPMTTCTRCLHAGLWIAQAFPLRRRSQRGATRCGLRPMAPWLHLPEARPPLARAKGSRMDARSGNQTPKGPGRPARRRGTKTGPARPLQGPHPAVGVAAPTHYSVVPDEPEIQTFMKKFLIFFLTLCRLNEADASATSAVPSPPARKRVYLGEVEGRPLGEGVAGQAQGHVLKVREDRPGAPEALPLLPQAAYDGRVGVGGRLEKKPRGVTSC